MKNTIEFTSTLVTPTMAKKLLEQNKSNRNVRNRSVIKYANDMENGRCKTNTAECIKIAHDGSIIDGQHRLLAIIKSNTAVLIHLATGLDREVFDVIDTGSNRSATDIFLIDGIKYNQAIPSIIQMYFSLQLNTESAKLKSRAKLTNAELLAFYHDDPKRWQFVARQTSVWYNNFAKILHPSVIGSCFSYFYDLNPDKAHDFMDQLTTGIDITFHPIYLLRNKLMQDRISSKKMSTNARYAYMIKTWNLYVQNKKASLLRYDESREDFPIALAN